VAGVLFLWLCFFHESSVNWLKGGLSQVIHPNQHLSALWALDPLAEECRHLLVSPAMPE
jgi:hypothetical protein